MNTQEKSPLPIRPYFLFLDFLGAVLLGLGIARYFASVDIIPASMRFQHYDIAFMTAGVLLMLPAVCDLVTTVKRGAGN